MNKFLFFTTTLFITVLSFAKGDGTNVNYELAERFSSKKVSRMVHSTMVMPNWFEGSNKFWYKWKTSDGVNYYIVDPVAKTQNEIFDLDKLAMDLTLITKDPFDAQNIPFQNFKLLKGDKKFSFEIQSKLRVEKKLTNKEKRKAAADSLKALSDTTKVASDKLKTKKKPEMVNKLFRFEYDWKTKKLVDVSDIEEKEKFPSWASISPDSSYVVYTKNFNLYYTDMANLRKLMDDPKDSTVVEHSLTKDGTRDFAFGGNNYSGLEDVDSTKRYYPNVLWSPNSKNFVTNKYDMTMVKDFWVINSLATPRPKLETYKYQMPGEAGPVTHTFVFNMDSKSCRKVKNSAYKEQDVILEMAPMKNKDRYEHYVPAIWLGDDSEFYLIRSSRDLHKIDVCKVELDSLNAQAVVEERLNTYNEVRSPKLVSDGKELIQWSERNGWAHLYLYSTDGKMKNAITEGAFHVHEIVRVDEKARLVYFTANGYDKDENPYYKHLYKVSFDGGVITALNPGDCFTEVNFSEDAKFFVENVSRVDMIPNNVLRDASGRVVLPLQEADFSQLFAAGYKFPETFKVKAADGVTDLYGVMYKPFDFDSTMVYPIIDYVYPGPQVEATNYVWSRGMNRVDRLSQLGFIVITVGQRGGHPDRSKWYHNYGYGNMRDYPLEDHKVAVQQLASRYDYIDGSKVGIHGHSGGGFMSTASLLTYPDFYTAAVSCAGNHDNRIYNRWWSETHHGVKEEVSEKGDTTFKYSIDFNQELVKNLKGRLLLVHGDIDNNVHPANTTRVVDALIRANKRFEMLYLPGQRHGFGDMDEYFFWKMADFFSRYLKDDYENSVDIPQMNND